MIFERLNIKNFIILLIFLGQYNIQAQDFHFSQVNKTPLLNSPANAGIMDNELRIGLNYREQWKVLNIPYNTVHFSVDKKFRVLEQHFAVSLNVINDLTNSNIVATKGLSLGLSYARFFEIHQFSIGAQFGRFMEGYDGQSIVFGRQFVDGVYTPSVLSGEGVLIDQISFNDFNLGLVWRSKVMGLEPLASIAFQHINKPNISYLDNEDEVLDLRVTFHGNVLIPFKEMYDFLPMLYYSRMAKAQELLFGTSFGIQNLIFEENIERVYSTALFRVNPAQNIDAMIVGGGIQFANFDLGISYDINISSLHKVSRFRGAFEISLIYMSGKPKIKATSEPCYML